MAREKINVGIIGFGTVGSGVVKILKSNASLIKKRLGVALEAKKIADLDLRRPRSVKVPRRILTKKALEVIRDPSINIVVEAIGGENPARKFISLALKNGKNVVTSNKEVIAKHGAEFVALACKNNVEILFEGAVGGGIPVIRPLKKCLVANNIKEIIGIVNGTTNYILSKMTAERKDFKSALKEAQEKGFAEANPTMDISGLDAAYKLAILSMVAFNAKINWRDIHYEGIERVAPEDIDYAEEVGYVVKLLAIAKKVPEGLELHVHPALISKDNLLASVSGVTNAVYVNGDMVGEVVFSGPGAGSLPTGSSVVADVVEVARRIVGREEEKYFPPLEPVRVRKVSQMEYRYYVRMEVPDKPGVLAKIAKVFGENNVSIQTVVQRETVGKVAQLVIILHKVKEGKVRSALSKIARLPVVNKICSVLRVRGE